MRSRFHRTMCLLGMLVFSNIALTLSAQADVYKFTDANGITHYTNVKPVNRQDFTRFSFPCYASDPTCGQLDWEQIPLNRKAFASEIESAARAFTVNASLIRAVIHAESAYQADALSPKGAQGLMQLMPETQRELQITDAFDPVSNIDGGTFYLSRLLDEFDQNIEYATAAYNAGSGAVRKYGGVPPFEETKEYVRRVKILYRRYHSD